MGFITTVSIRNDGLDELRENPKEFANTLHAACCDINSTNQSLRYSSLLIAQKPRHADDNTLYLHAGNTVIDVYNATGEWAINTYITEMEYHLKRLKKLKKEMKHEKKNKKIL